MALKLCKIIIDNPDFRANDFIQADSFSNYLSTKKNCFLATKSSLSEKENFIIDNKSAQKDPCTQLVEKV